MTFAATVYDIMIAAITVQHCTQSFECGKLSLDDDGEQKKCLFNECFAGVMRYGGGNRTDGANRTDLDEFFVFELIKIKHVTSRLMSIDAENSLISEKVWVDQYLCLKLNNHNL